MIRLSEVSETKLEIHLFSQASTLRLSNNSFPTFLHIFTFLYSGLQTHVPDSKASFVAFPHN